MDTSDRYPGCVWEGKFQFERSMGGDVLQNGKMTFPNGEEWMGEFVRDGSQEFKLLGFVSSPSKAGSVNSTEEGIWRCLDDGKCFLVIE